MSIDDEVAIGAVVSAFYGAFDNRDGRPPAMAALARLFEADATVARVDAETGTVQRMSVAAFIEPRAALLTGGRLVDFHEWETEGRTTVLGGIAVRVSRYAKRGLLDGADYRGTGRKILTFQHAGSSEGERETGGWLIHAVLWEDDRLGQETRDATSP